MSILFFDNSLMVGLTYLKYLHNLSDEKVIKQFLQNPYWQYFCGNVCFQKKAPLEASSLTRFRERLGERGAEELLRQTVEVARKGGLLRKRDLKGSDSGYNSPGEEHQAIRQMQS